jgi:hypothetical protein
MDDVAANLYETRDEASAQSLLGGQVPAPIGATSNLFGIHVSAVDQLCEPSVFQAQSMVNVGNHLFELRGPQHDAAWCDELGA